MTNKNTIDEVNVSKCKYFNNGWCLLSESCDAIRYRLCGDMTLFDCYYRNWQHKEQECEELKNELHKNFEEKDKLHLIIDRLLEASGYDTNTTSAEDFEDVYENMRYEQQQLGQLKQTLTEIKEIAEGMHDLWINKTPYTDMDNLVKHLLECELNRIRYKLDEISECEAKNE